MQKKRNVNEYNGMLGFLLFCACYCKFSCIHILYTWPVPRVFIQEQRIETGQNVCVGLFFPFIYIDRSRKMEKES